MGRMSKITQQAEQLLAHRVESVRVLEERRNEAARARELVASAERSEAEARTAATKAGWTAKELTRLGFEQPASRRGGRTASAGSNRHKASPQAPAENES